ncbi:MAG: CsbD family protein [Solirubrobacteraceae bacterium]|jgi:uncharacterized protein YjbJ (UPF0337 family)
MPANNVDEVKGRIKEAAGVLTGNERLRREGRLDQARHTIKNAVDKIFDRFQGTGENKT